MTSAHGRLGGIRDHPTRRVGAEFVVATVLAYIGLAGYIVAWTATNSGVFPSVEGVLWILGFTTALWELILPIAVMLVVFVEIVRRFRGSGGRSR